MIWILAVMHLLVDAVCAAAVMSSRGRITPEQLAIWILIYNGLAFSTQPVFGFIADRVKQSVRLTGIFQGRFRQGSMYVSFAILGAVIVAGWAGFHAILPISVILVGVGNSLFHIGGGGYALDGSCGKAAKVGFFVGPGAIGLALGIAFPQLFVFFKAALAIITITSLVMNFKLAKRLIANKAVTAADTGHDSVRPPIAIPERIEIKAFEWIAVALLICAAVAFRAFGGAFPSFPWKAGTLAIFASVGFVVAGKMLGGVIHDRIGALPILIASFLLSTILLSLFSERMDLGLAGLFFLNIAMPVTVYLLYRANKGYPSFAFGLTAAALYPGTLAAAVAIGRTKVTGEISMQALFACVSVLAFFCVYLAYRLIRRHEKQGD